MHFSSEIQIVLDLAQKEATSNKQKYVNSEDIFFAILQSNNSTITKLLSNLNISKEKIQNEILSQKDTKSQTNSNKNTKLDYHPDVKKLTQESSNQAKLFQAYEIKIIHLFLAFIKNTPQEIQSIINQNFHSYQAIKSAVENLSEETENQSFIKKYGINLTEQAKLNKLDPVFGRYDEIEQIIQILARRRKNNPVLYGEAGVGKTAIIEGIAQKIANNEAGEFLNNKEIIQLSIHNIIAGASKRGEFEERLNKIINEVKNSQNRIILFIDEIHTLVDPDNSQDTANILKPALARGEIQAIGATTTSEYRKIFEKDSAFERRFQAIYIDEPDEMQTLNIIQGLRPKYENFHQIKIPDEILEKAIYLSTKYITKRKLPDKAIDLIDQTASSCKIPNIALPGKIQALKNILVIKEKKLQKFQALNNQELLIPIKEEIHLLNEKIKKLQIKLNEKKDRKTIGIKDLLEVTSKITNIPIKQLDQDEKDKILNIENNLNKKVIGQKEATSKIANAILRNSAGLGKKDRPIGSFIFMGQTGVGKTELAEQLSELLFGKKEALIRFDMSEFTEKHSASKLIGAPPGYVGYEQGGQLTERIRTQAHSIILFDEIEKAHPEIFNLLLQILDEGHLTDNQGNIVNFKNTIIICTSNLGSQNQNLLDINKIEENKKKGMLSSILLSHLKLELINRFDEIIYFNNLNKSDLISITKLLIHDTIINLSQKDISFQLTENAANALIDQNFDPKFGARPLKYAIQREIETPLAKKIIQGEFQTADHIICDYINNEFILSKTKNINQGLQKPIDAV